MFAWFFEQIKGSYHQTYFPLLFMMNSMNTLFVLALLAICNELHCFRCTLHHNRRILSLGYNHPNPFRQYDKETAKKMFNHTPPKQGTPVVYLRDEKTNLAYIKLIVSSAATAEAFNASCTMFKKVCFLMMLKACFA